MLYKERVFQRPDKDGKPEYFIVRRKFLGKLENFIDKEDKALEKKHLKAYLRGYTSFRHGYKTVNSLRVPKWFNVQEGIAVIPISEEEAKRFKGKIHDITSKDNS